MRSKRERKSKNLNSLRAKKAKPGGDGAGVCTGAAGDGAAALADAGGGAPAPLDPADADDPNALILPARAAKGASTTEPDVPLPPAKRLSKSAARKARRVEEERVARAARAAALATLAAHALPPEHRALLRSTASLGQTDTKKQRLRRDLAAERLGLELGPDSDLLRTRPVVREGDGPVAQAPVATPTLPARGLAVSPSSSDDDESDSDARPTPPPPRAGGVGGTTAPCGGGRGPGRDIRRVFGSGDSKKKRAGRAGSASPSLTTTPRNATPCVGLTALFLACFPLHLTPKQPGQATMVVAGPD